MAGAILHRLSDEFVPHGDEIRLDTLVNPLPPQQKTSVPPGRSVPHEYFDQTPILVLNTFSFMLPTKV